MKYMLLLIALSLVGCAQKKDEFQSFEGTVSKVMNFILSSAHAGDSSICSSTMAASSANYLSLAIVNDFAEPIVLCRTSISSEGKYSFQLDTKFLPESTLLYISGMYKGEKRSHLVQLQDFSKNSAIDPIVSAVAELQMLEVKDGNPFDPKMSENFIHLIKSSIDTSKLSIKELLEVTKSLLASDSFKEALIHLKNGDKIAAAEGLKSLLGDYALTDEQRKEREEKLAALIKLQEEGQQSGAIAVANSGAAEEVLASSNDVAQALAAAQAAADTLVKAEAEAQAAALAEAQAQAAAQAAAQAQAQALAQAQAAEAAAVQAAADLKAAQDAAAAQAAQIAQAAAQAAIQAAAAAQAQAEADANAAAEALALAQAQAQEAEAAIAQAEAQAQAQEEVLEVAEAVAEVEVKEAEILEAMEPSYAIKMLDGEGNEVDAKTVDEVLKYALRMSLKNIKHPKVQDFLVQVDPGVYTKAHYLYFSPESRTDAIAVMEDSGVGPKARAILDLLPEDASVEASDFYPDSFGYTLEEMNSVPEVKELLINEVAIIEKSVYYYDSSDLKQSALILKENGIYNKVLELMRNAGFSSPFYKVIFGYNLEDLTSVSEIKEFLSNESDFINQAMEAFHNGDTDKSYEILKSNGHLMKMYDLLFNSGMDCPFYKNVFGHSLQSMNKVAELEKFFASRPDEVVKAREIYQSEGVESAQNYLLKIDMLQKIQEIMKSALGGSYALIEIYDDKMEANYPQEQVLEFLSLALSMNSEDVLRSEVQEYLNKYDSKMFQTFMYIYSYEGDKNEIVEYFNVNGITESAHQVAKQAAAKGEERVQMVAMEAAEHEAAEKM